MDNKKEKPRFNCPDCGKKIWRKSKKCKSCAQIIRQQAYCISCKRPITYGAKNCLACHNKKQDKGLSKERAKFQNKNEWKALRKKCFERDDYICQRCKNKGGELNAHHVLSWKERKDLRLCLKNLITLCRKCHEFVHWGCL